jgi:hypothetical protein
VGTNGILECKTFLPKTRTVQQSKPDDANPNTAEYMMENAHRANEGIPANTPILFASNGNRITCRTGISALPLLRAANAFAMPASGVTNNQPIIF